MVTGKDIAYSPAMSNRDEIFQHVARYPNLQGACPPLMRYAHSSSEEQPQGLWRVTARTFETSSTPLIFYGPRGRRCATCQRPDVYAMLLAIKTWDAVDFPAWPGSAIKHTIRRHHR